MTNPPPMPVPRVRYHTLPQSCPTPQRYSASAAPLTSVSIATGQVRTPCTDPNMSAPDQPGLGVVRIWPKWELPGSRLTGPKLAIPTAFTGRSARSEEHTSELQSLMRISYAVFCLKKKRNKNCHHI